MQKFSEQGAEKIFFRYLEKIDRKTTIHPLGYDGLAEHDKELLSAYEFELEVSNGGLEQYFINPAGDNWEKVYSALKTMGSKRILKIFDETIKLFPNGQPSV